MAVFLWIIAIFVASGIGQGKGYHWSLGAGFGILLGWIGVLIMLIFPKKV